MATSLENSNTAVATTRSLESNQASAGAPTWNEAWIGIAVLLGFVSLLLIGIAAFGQFAFHGRDYWLLVFEDDGLLLFGQPIAYSIVYGLSVIGLHLGLIAFAVAARHPWGALGVAFFPILGAVAYFLYCLARAQDIFAELEVPPGKPHNGIR